MKQAVFFNGGKESLIVLHKYMHNSIIVYVDDDNDPQEIKDYVNYITQQYNINLLRFKDMKESIISLKENYNIDTVIIGCRRTDPGCEFLKEYQETDANWPNIMRFNPLIDWTYKDVWNYIEEHKLPVCSLYERGYTSIGSKTNTFANYGLFDCDSFKHAKYLEDGSTERAGRIKTHLPLQFSGKVIRGKGLGKGLGFPTANIDTILNIDEGVYYGYAKFSDNIKHKMVMSIGINPQFGDKSVEVHILKEFEKDFYDEYLEVDVVGFIRKMLKFDSLDGLIKAIHKDIKIAHHLL